MAVRRSRPPVSQLTRSDQEKPKSHSIYKFPSPLKKSLLYFILLIFFPEFVKTSRPDINGESLKVKKENLFVNET